jgi:hypothetical protein
VPGEVDTEGDAQKRVGEGLVVDSHSPLRRAGGEPSYILLVESRHRL